MVLVPPPSAPRRRPPFPGGPPGSPCGGASGSCTGEVKWPGRCLNGRMEISRFTPWTSFDCKNFNGIRRNRTPRIRLQELFLIHLPFLACKKVFVYSSK